MIGNRKKKQGEQEEMKAKKYEVTLTGETPLLMHMDNIKAGERVKAWIADPSNKARSVKGDDRTPPFTWIGFCYHDTKRLVVHSDNLMSMLRDGGKKCPNPNGRGSLKSQTQAGIMVNEIGWPILVDGAEIPWAPINALMDESDFEEHENVARALGFELFVKRARVGTNKHVRVRPRFDSWKCKGTITILDEMLTKPVLDNVFKHAGFYCGLCDWRPGSPSAPGQFGRFTANLKLIK